MKVHELIKALEGYDRDAYCITDMHSGLAFLVESLIPMEIANKKFVYIGRGKQEGHWVPQNTVNLRED